MSKNAKYVCYGQFIEGDPDCDNCEDRILCRDSKLKGEDQEKILCDSCEWFITKGKKLQCMHFKEKERLKLIAMKSFDCPEYQLDHRLATN